jgi:hypothetical protein
VAAKLIAELHARDPTHPTFDQVGLLSGAEVVAEFIGVNELGCALSHLLYMIHGSAIEFPKERVLRLHGLAADIGEPNHYSEESLEKMPVEQRRLVCNAP